MNVLRKVSIDTQLCHCHRDTWSMLTNLMPDQWCAGGFENSAVLRVQVSVQVGSLTVQAAVRDLEPPQGRQPAGGSGASSGKRQQHKTARKQKKSSAPKDTGRDQGRQERQGSDATVQSSANTVDVRGQRALEVGTIYVMGSTIRVQRLVQSICSPGATDSFLCYICGGTTRSRCKQMISAELSREKCPCNAGTRGG